MNKKRSFLRTAAAYPHMLWSLLFIVVPLLFVLYYALTVENPDGSFSFSFSNITALGSESYFPVFIRSICFAVEKVFLLWYNQKNCFTDGGSLCCRKLFCCV